MVTRPSFELWGFEWVWIQRLAIMSACEHVVTIYYFLSCLYLMFQHQKHQAGFGEAFYSLIHRRGFLEGFSSQKYSLFTVFYDFTLADWLETSGRHLIF